MGGYQHHIFISYRRSSPQDIRWAHDCFRYAIKTFLGRAITGLDIFMDTDIEIGELWPEKLKDALAASCVLVPVFQTTYFDSEWCKLELDLMRQREKRLMHQNGGKRQRLVFPVIIEDGEDFSDPIKAILHQPMQRELSNPFVLPNTPEFIPVSEKIRKLCEAIKPVLQAPPAWDAAWRDMEADTSHPDYVVQLGVQTTAPVHSSIILPP